MMEYFANVSVDAVAVSGGMEAVRSEVQLSNMDLALRLPQTPLSEWVYFAGEFCEWIKNIKREQMDELARRFRWDAVPTRQHQRQRHRKQHARGEWQ